MITWLDVPFKGTNVASGFEVLVHGFILTTHEGNPSLWALCIDEEGVITMYPHNSIALDWRFTRGKGWHSIDDQEPE